eukprot:gene7261-biopygen3497
MKDPTRRIAGWLITLGEYPFIAVYRKGSLNGNADALSRLPSQLVIAEAAVVSSQGSIRTINFAEEDFLDNGSGRSRSRIPNHYPKHYLDFWTWT